MRWKIDKGPCELNLRRKGPCEPPSAHLQPTFSPPSGRKRTMCAHLQPTFRKEKDHVCPPSAHLQGEKDHVEPTFREGKDHVEPTFRKKRTMWSLPSGRKGPCGAYLQGGKVWLELKKDQIIA